MSSSDITLRKPYFQSSHLSSLPSKCSGRAKPFRSTIDAAAIVGNPDADADGCVSGSTIAATVRPRYESAKARLHSSSSGTGTSSARRCVAASPHGTPLLAAPRGSPPIWSKIMKLRLPPAGSAQGPNTSMSSSRAQAALRISSRLRPSQLIH
jgi:hypothetical protein